MAGMIPNFRALIEEPTPRSAYRGLKFHHAWRARAGTDPHYCEGLIKAVS